MPRFGTRSLTELHKKVDPTLIIFATAFLFKYPEYDITVMETVRTPERQKELVKHGVSWTLKSKHLTGRAMDIYPVGWRQFEKCEWDLWAKRIEDLAKDLGFPIRCGWTLWGKDAFHIELP